MYQSAHTTHENTETNTRENSAKNSPRKVLNTSQNRPKMIQHKPQIFSFTPKEDLSGRFLYNNSEKDIENTSNKSIIEKEGEEEEDKDGNITEGNYHHMIITTASVLCFSSAPSNNVFSYHIICISSYSYDIILLFSPFFLKINLKKP